MLKEDESGSLKATVEEILFQSKKRRCVCSSMFCMLGGPLPDGLSSCSDTFPCLDRLIESHGQVRLGMVS